MRAAIKRAKTKLRPFLITVKRLPSSFTSSEAVTTPTIVRVVMKAAMVMSVAPDRKSAAANGNETRLGRSMTAPSIAAAIVPQGPEPWPRYQVPADKLRGNHGCEEPHQAHYDREARQHLEQGPLPHTERHKGPPGILPEREGESGSNKPVYQDNGQTLTFNPISSEVSSTVHIQLQQLSQTSVDHGETATSTNSTAANPLTPEPLTGIARLVCQV